jgi:peptide deformylase
MAIRKIRTDEDEILRKKCKVVTVFDENLEALVADMIETMYDANGVGLAAPQIGLLKRLFVIDVGEGPVVFVNPEIVALSGEQTGEEGCLSVPGKYGQVTRPNCATLRAQDQKGNWFEITGEELLARAMLHEFDHLDGKLYVELVEGDLLDVQ